MVFERDALIEGEWWRLWTAHLTHFTLSQLIVDSGIIAILGYVVQRYLKSVYLLTSILLSMPVISGLIFWLVPDLSVYRGASAIGAMLWMLASTHFLYECKMYSVNFWLGVLFLLALPLKISGEALSLLPVISELNHGVQIAWQAHLFGALTGIVIFSVHKLTEREARA